MRPDSTQLSARFLGGNMHSRLRNRKIAVIAWLLVCYTGYSFSQGWLGKATQFAKSADVTRLLIQQQKRALARYTLLETELAQRQLVPLHIANMPTKEPLLFAQHASLNTDPPQTVSGQLVSAYNDSYATKNHNLDYFLIRQNKENNSEERLLYRGMRLSNLEEVRHILLHGLETNKTNYKAVYMSAAPFYARRFAEILPESKETLIPTIVAIEGNILVDHIDTDLGIGEYYSDTDIPADAIVHMFVFLNINQEAAWYRVVEWKDGMVFIPLPNLIEILVH